MRTIGTHACLQERDKLLFAEICRAACKRRRVIRERRRHSDWRALQSAIQIRRSAVALAFHARRVAITTKHNAVDEIIAALNERLARELR